MTQINLVELAKLKTLDQGIVWAALSLTRSNKHRNNVWYSDNASIRQEVAKDLSNWTIQQDPQGQGNFSFTAIMPLLDEEPMQSKVDICEIIKSYSAFLLNDQTVDEPTTTKGFPLPELPAYIQTLEQLLFYLVRIAEAVGRMIRYANAAALSPSPPTEPVTLDLTNPVPVLGGIVGISASGSTSTAEGIINQYETGQPIYEGFSDWIQEIFDGFFDPVNGGIPASDQVDTSGGYQEKGIETLPQCKEQDPNVTSLSDGNLLDLLTKK
jgi:hypothetical protein